MFYGRWEITIDENWRLRLPNSLNEQFQDFVLLREGQHCLEIHKINERVEETNAPFIFFQKIKNKKFTIPQVLRKLNSFFFGKNVILAGKGSYLEVWPRP